MVLREIAFVLFYGVLVQGDCPDVYFKCPTGETITFGTCWVWSAFNCQTCRSIEHEVRTNCRQFSCDGSVEEWYGRNDGCSAKGVSAVMTHVFRAACMVHDLCYATPGTTKEQCDKDFGKNMITTCSMPGIGSFHYLKCAATAGIAYLVVRDHASTFPIFAAKCTEV